MYMRKILILGLCLSLQAFDVYAIPSQIKAFSKGALSIQKRNFLPLAMQRSLALEMRKYALNPKRFTLDQHVVNELVWNCLNNYPAEMHADIQKKYLKALSATIRLAKTLDTEIFYQGTFENR